MHLVSPLLGSSIGCTTLLLDSNTAMCPDETHRCSQDTPNTLKVLGSNVTGNSVQSNGGGIYGDNMNLADFTAVQFADNIAGTGELPTQLCATGLCCTSRSLFSCFL